MKLKCDDGVVREFKVSEVKKGLHRGSLRDAFCVHCGETFGCHDTHILKPKFRKHTCKAVHEQEVSDHGR